MTDYRQKSWWLQSLPQDIVPNPPLEGSSTADVTIIGGGYTGLSTAYHLKTLCPQLNVCLLESDICGYGASGRNGGFSMTLFGLTKGITAFRFDDKKARSAHLYMQQAVDYLHDLINTHNIDCDYEQSGYLLAATSAAQVRRIEHDFSIMEKWGLAHHVQRWDKTRLNQEFKTNYYRLGWFEPGCGILNPAKLARGLKQVAEKTGAFIFEQTPVTGFYRKKDKTFVVTTPSARIQSRYLVFATNAYSVLFDKLRALQRPAFTHIVMTEPLTDAQMQSIGWQCRAGIEDARDLIHYYRLTRDNRIVTQTFSPACRHRLYPSMGRAGFCDPGHGPCDRVSWI
jgi:glycine/D-amino acid oxidase-like deaminating enzyme